MEIGMRIYYDPATGSVILNTGERSGSVVLTSIEEDFTAYRELADHTPETVGVLQLEYGQYAEEFQGIDGYRVNPATEALEFSYPDPEKQE
ncbi:hypothetical protein [Paenibacillus sp. BAC0078]